MRHLYMNMVDTSHSFLLKPDIDWSIFTRADITILQLSSDCCIKLVHTSSLTTFATCFLACSVSKFPFLIRLSFWATVSLIFLEKKQIISEKLKMKNYLTQSTMLPFRCNSLISSMAWLVKFSPKNCGILQQDFKIISLTINVYFSS